MLARPGPPGGATKGKDGGADGRAKGPGQNGAAGARKDGQDDPGDVMTSAEAAEAALPSGDPASGPHPHAPGAPSHAFAQANGAAAASKDASPSAGELEAVRAALNQRYSGAVEGREVAEMHALLGSQHIFICKTF
jgi:hypothetical protein